MRRNRWQSGCVRVRVCYQRMHVVTVTYRSPESGRVVMCAFGVNEEIGVEILERELSFGEACLPLY